MLRNLFRKKLRTVKAGPTENHKVAGLEFRVFTDPAKLPLYRAVKLLNQREHSIWKITEPTVDIYQAKLIKLLEAKPPQTEAAVKLINYVNELRGMQATIATVLEYVDCFVLLPNEPIDRPDPSFRNIKIQLAENEEVLDFFLALITPLLKDSLKLPKDITTYLVEADRIQTEKRLLHFITRPLVLNFSKV